MKYIFADVETSGLSPSLNDILSLCLIFTDKDFLVEKEYHTTVRPLSPTRVSQDALDVNGFTYDQIMKFPDPLLKAYEILYLLKRLQYRNKKYTFVFHALKAFDYLFLENYFRDHGLIGHFHKYISQQDIVSTIDISRKYSEVTGLKRHDLKTVSDYIGFDLKHHDAISDTYACFEIFKHFHKHNQENMI